MNPIFLSTLFFMLVTIISCEKNPAAEIDSEKPDSVNSGDVDSTVETVDKENTVDIDDTDKNAGIPDSDSDENTDNEDDPDNNSDADSDSDDNNAEYTRYIKQWGTSTEDFAFSLALDNSDNLFIAGVTRGAFSESANAGYDDIFLTKLNSDKSIAWTRQWGTSCTDSGNSVAINSSGNLFVTGSTCAVFEENTSAGYYDNILTKLNNAGVIMWTKQWGTAEYEEGESLAIDSSDNIYVTGYTSGVFDGNTSAGESDIFLTKLDGKGSVVWTKQWGTDRDDYCYSVVIDSADNIFVLGRIEDTLLQDTHPDDFDIFLTKLNIDGLIEWTKQWGSEDKDDFPLSIAVDRSGSVFVTGYTFGDLAGKVSPEDKGDIFLVKLLGSDGSIEWTKQWGTGEFCRGNSVTVDSSGSIFVTGNASGIFDGNIIYSNIYSTSFLTKLNSDGSIAWIDQWGADEGDYAKSVVVDNKGGIFVTGGTEGNLEENTERNYFWDIFLAVFLD